MATVNINGTTIPNFNYVGSVFSWRIFSDKSWVAADGTVVPARGDSNTFYKEVTLTVVGTTATAPAITLLSQTDAPNEKNARYSIYFYVDGIEKDMFLANTLGAFQVPDTPVTTNWSALEQYNFGTNHRYYKDERTYPALVIDQKIAASSAANFVDATTLQKGVGLASRAPTVPTAPVFVVDNDQRVVDASSFASLALAISTLGSTPTTLNISTAQSVAASVSVPATCGLRFIGAGKLTIASGQVVTIAGPLSAEPRRQIFAGIGTVSFIGNTSLTDIYPQWWGAALDDATDDSAAINAAIVSLGSTSTTRGGPRIIITGPAAIGSTVLINRKSITFAGLGWGRQGSTGQQPYLRWIGSAGSPMLRLQNVQGLTVENLHLIGNASAKPSCAISFFQEAGFGINANVLRNVAIGNLTDGTQISGGFTVGIAWEGATANNAEWEFYNVSVDGCTTAGLRQNSVQNVNCAAYGLQITNSVIGMYITGEIHGTNWEFVGNSNADIFFPIQDDTPQNILGRLNVVGYHSEGSARMAIISQEAQMSVTMGSFQVGSFTAADGKYIKHEGQGNACIRLKDFAVGQVSVPTVTPFISLVRTSYFNQSLDILDLDGVAIPSGGPDSNGVSAATKGFLDQKYISFRDITGNATDSDGAPVTATTNYLGGVLGTGPGFQLNRIDIPGRIRTPPSTEPTINNDITAAGNAIVVNRHLVIISNTTGGAITLTSTPTIADGANGEIIRVMNLGTQSVVLQDQGTLASSNLRLTGNSITLGPRDSVELIFFATTGGVTLGDWVQTGNVVNVL